MDKFILNIIGNFQTIKLSVSSIVAVAGGFAVSFLGGMDKMLMTLITMMVIDYATGVIKAILKKKLSSSAGFTGILKKMLILLMVGFSVTLQNVLPAGVPLREITVLFFIANEGISILENVSQIIPLPKKLSCVLYKIQQEAETLGENAEVFSQKDNRELNQKDPKA